MKRTASVFLALFLALLPAAPGAWAEAALISSPLTANRVTDNAGVLTASDVDALEEAIAIIRDTYDFDVVILTETSIGNQSVEYYSELYYAAGDFGYGENHDGIMLLLVLNDGQAGSRQYFIMNTGRAIALFPDSVMYDMEDRFLPYLRISDYSAGISQFVKDVQAQLEAAREPASFRYLDTFSFGMTKKEVEAAAEELFSLPPNKSEQWSFADFFIIAYQIDSTPLLFIGRGDEDVWRLSEIMDAAAIYPDIYSENDEAENAQQDEDNGDSSFWQNFEALRQGLILRYGACQPVQTPVSEYIAEFAAEDYELLVFSIFRWQLPQPEGGAVIIELLNIEEIGETAQTIVYRYVDQAAYDALLAE